MSGVMQKNGELGVTIQVDRRQPEVGGNDLQPIRAGCAQAQAPEKKLTLFALRLAVLEKAASRLGTLGFVWATVVLLGGFAITLDKVDFLVVTTILLIEGARIFSRSHELEWQHHATWSSSSRNSARCGFRVIKSALQDLKSTSFGSSSRGGRSRHGTRGTVAGDGVIRSQRTWNSTEVSLLPYTGWMSLSKNVSRILYWFQLLSATACVSLSLMRLIKQDYGDFSKCDSDKRNRKSALNIFYGLALAEALLFLLEKAYWEWKITFCDLLVEVAEACGFDAETMPMRRFFYDAYSRCIDGSIFDGLKMDLVSFSEELLGSDSPDEQLIGARILLKSVTDDKHTADTLRKMGTSARTMERLVEMLNWKNPAEEELRMAAAEIVLALAGKKQNILRVAGIPGSIESISSLLHDTCQGTATGGQRDQEFSAFDCLGLQILKKLAHDHDNCAKIGNTRGLLPKVIGFTGDAERALGQTYTTPTQINCIKYSLQLLKMLTGTSGYTGRLLRRELTEIVFTVGNVRDVLQYGKKNNHNMKLQKLAIEVLTSLAMDGEAKDRIGCTGGIFRELFAVFFGPTEERGSASVDAGEALVMLTLESTANCDRILRLEVVDRLVSALGHPVLTRNAARILRNLCDYAGDGNVHRLRGVTAATTVVLKAVMHEEGRMLEDSLGLAAQIFKFLGPEEAAEEFRKAGIGEGDLARKLVKTLSHHRRPRVECPRTRRFAIELATWMMTRLDEVNRWVFREAGLGKELENTANTTSEIECSVIFSGGTGLGRHRTTMGSLVDVALEVLGNCSDGWKARTSKLY